MTIGQKVQKYLHDMGKSQYWLSKASGLSASYISELVNGKYNNPTSETLQKLSIALGVSVSKLLSKSA